MYKVALRCIVFVSFAVPAICRVLSVGQHAVSVCHGSVCVGRSISFVMSRIYSLSHWTNLEGLATQVAALPYSNGVRM